MFSEGRTSVEAAGRPSARKSATNQGKLAEA